MTWFIFEMLERAHVLVIKILLIVLTLCVNLTRNEDGGSQSWMLQVTNNLSSARDCKTPNISQERKPLIKHYTWQSGFVFKSVAYNAYSFQIVNREFSVEVRELSWTWFSTRFFFLCVSSLIQNILPVLHQALMYCSLTVGIVWAVKSGSLCGNSCLEEQEEEEEGGEWGGGSWCSNHRSL